MIAFASASVMGHRFTFCIRVTVVVQPSRSLFLPSGRESSWHVEHFASNSAFACGSPAGTPSVPPGAGVVGAGA